MTGSAGFLCLLVGAAQPAAAEPKVDFGFEVGLAQGDFGALEVPLQPVLRLSATRVKELGPATLGLGVLGTYYAASYAGPQPGTARFSQQLLHAELSLKMFEGLFFRLEAGAGLMVLWGLGSTTPFTAHGAEATGPISFLSIRGAIGVDIPVRRSLRLRISLGTISYSPRRDGLDPTIGHLVRSDLTIGLGMSL